MTSVTTPYGITALTMEDVEQLKMNTTVLTHSFTDSEFSIKPIQGEPIIATIHSHDVWDQVQWSKDQDEEIKYMLVRKLAEAMYKSGKYIEFTKEQLVNENGTIFRARVFVTPGDVTQLLRVNKVIK